MISDQPSISKVRRIQPAGGNPAGEMKATYIVTGVFDYNLHLSCPPRAWENWQIIQVHNWPFKTGAGDTLQAMRKTL